MTSGRVRYRFLDAETESHAYRSEKFPKYTVWKSLHAMSYKVVTDLGIFIDVHSRIRDT